MHHFAPTEHSFLARRIDERSTDPFRWLIVDSTYPGQIAERLRLLETHPDYFIDRLPTPGVPEAEIELRDHVVNYLTETYPDWFRRSGNIFHSPLTGLSVDIGPDGADPLVAVALLASEDLEIMLPTHRDDSNPNPQLRGEAFTFQSGALLFGHGWSLRSHFNEGASPERNPAQSQEISEYVAELGRTLSEIHFPGVEEYKKKFTGGDAFFHKLPPGGLAWRRNWAPKIGNQMCLHPDLPDNRPKREQTVENWDQYGVIRSEHETFLKLPTSGAVVFGIKTYVWSLRDMVADAIVRQALITSRDNLSPELRDYRQAVLPSFDLWLNQFRDDQQTKAHHSNTKGKCPFHHSAS